MMAIMEDLHLFLRRSANAEHFWKIVGLGHTVVLFEWNILLRTVCLVIGTIYLCVVDFYHQPWNKELSSKSFYNSFLLGFSFHSFHPSLFFCWFRWRRRLWKSPLLRPNHPNWSSSRPLRDIDETQLMLCSDPGIPRKTCYDYHLIHIPFWLMSSNRSKKKKNINIIMIFLWSDKWLLGTVKANKAKRPFFFWHHMRHNDASCLKG